MKPTLFLLLLCLCLGTRLAPVFGQSITVQSTQTFTSPVAGTAGATIDDMIQLDRSQLYRLTPAVGPFGIIATMRPGAVNGSVSVKVYSIDNDVLYSVATSGTTTTYGGTSTAVTSTNYPFGVISGGASATLGLADYNTGYSTFEQLGAPIPVRVVVTVTEATFVGANIPGIGLYNPRDLPRQHKCQGNDDPVCVALRKFKTEDKNKVVVAAHRGFWGGPGVAEGSMAALRNAYDNKYRVVELDLMLSKDHVPVLMHDQEVNRLTSYGITYPTPDEDPAGWVNQMNYKTSTPQTATSGIPRAASKGGGIYSSYPPLKDATMLDRQGNDTGEKLDSLQSALDYLKVGGGVAKDVLLSLDIKDKDKANYLLNLRRSLQLGARANLLRQMIFKPGSAAAVTPADIKASLPTRLWETFCQQTNIIVIILVDKDSKLNEVRARVNDWMAIPSVICFEFIYKYNVGDPLLVNSPDFDNLSAIKFAKNLGYRTGINWEIPTDCRGVPNGRGTWYDKSVPEPTNSVPQLDGRTNPEWLLTPPGDGNRPGSVVTDRPDVLEKILDAYGINLSEVSKRP